MYANSDAFQVSLVAPQQELEINVASRLYFLIVDCDWRQKSAAMINACSALRDQLNAISASCCFHFHH